MALSDYINTFGQQLLTHYGERVHKLAINAGMNCPNRDGSKGIGGCTFCNNSSFSPHARQPDPVIDQLDSGRRVLPKRTGAKKYLAYFQAYTNTYDDIARLTALYEQALSQPDVIGLSIGTRPDCLPEPVLDLLARYREQGYLIWLELGLQSSFDTTLERVNRGHGFAEYVQAVEAVHRYGINLCTHLIIGLPGEQEWHQKETLSRVLELGVHGLKLHPLHVVKGTRLANSWRAGDYRPWELERYVATAVDLIEMTPPQITYHRVTATAANDILLAPAWCNAKWRVLNAIEDELARRGGYQGITNKTLEPRYGSNG